MSDQRLIFRAIIQDGMSNQHDLRVLANKSGLLKIFLMGISRSLSYAGIREDRLPATVSQGGGTNALIADRVRRCVGEGCKIVKSWVEPEVGGGAEPAEILRDIQSLSETAREAFWAMLDSYYCRHCRDIDCLGHCQDTPGDDN